MRVDQGRFFTGEDLDSRRRFAVIGRTVVGELFGDEAPLGQVIKVADAEFRIIGVMEHKGTTLGFDMDDLVFIPTTTAMDVFALPSRDEGFGLVFLEAMAMGVPVVGTRVIGSEDAVDDGATGLLVPYADAPALAHAIRRLLEDSELARRLRNTAAERVRRTSSREQFAAQVEALYRELLQSRAVSRPRASVAAGGA